MPSRDETIAEASGNDAVFESNNWHGTKFLVAAFLKTLTVKTKVAEIQPPELNEIQSVHITFQLGARFQPYASDSISQPGSLPENN